MTTGRERGLAALLCAAGAGLTLLAAARPWATVKAKESITPFSQDLTGHALGGTPSALAWAGLAGLAALFATSGRLRAAVGVLIALFGAGIGYASVVAVRHSHIVTVAGDKSALLRIAARPEVATGPWWAVSLAGGVLMAAAGVIVVLRGARWPGMSARYERRPAKKAVGPGDDPSKLWKSLDQGEDPTDQGQPLTDQGKARSDQGTPPAGQGVESAGQGVDRTGADRTGPGEDRPAVQAEDAREPRP
ncbi:Trp biosynthesis-associated membrane protein [Actinomadura barringtoniae]|uniref:Trp biosynthesis-associated membrane protein n=1 Tax=Actinomadura barringtoniae TaxID=1427535 RepID=A0A939PBY4_9ACTN|nr:Trp biosynthesis-associated membrane protein [Actinomadura barringtoniae]MBO2449780.1 Trp biosynthesis-associated membrane protein [Actinomadura barringtoniae]